MNRSSLSLLSDCIFETEVPIFGAYKRAAMDLSPSQAFPNGHPDKPQGGRNYIALLSHNVGGRWVGDEVFVHIFEDGRVLLYGKAGPGKPTFDRTYPTVHDASLHATCICRTSIDVLALWNKMIGDRYFH